MNNLLIILDGWGHREQTENNAIAAANTPNWDQLWSSAPHTLLSASGLDVGLPDQQMGNSEVGHLCIGSGRRIKQDLVRIDEDIAAGGLGSNQVLQDALRKAKAAGGKAHILGLLSPGGVHSHERHIQAVAAIAAEQGLEPLIQAFLDGRDTPPRSAAASLHEMEQHLAGKGRIASVCGRYYAMDRDQRWERTAAAWGLLARGEAEYQAASSAQALQAAYARGESDEFVKPTLIIDQKSAPCPLRPEDCVIFMNFRADRARQLSRALSDADFNNFQRPGWKAQPGFITLTEYADDIQAPSLYPSRALSNVLGEHLANLGKTQLHIAETEKYAHVTFFFNGGREAPFPGEERILTPSPNVATYDLAPQMSAFEITENLTKALRQERFDFIVCNFANGDMVGHTGSFPAAVQAAETLDLCLGNILDAVSETGGQCLITADHGNLEQMYDHSSGQEHTAHTCYPVPLVYHGPASLRLAGEGSLVDVAPTLLELMQLPQAPEMTGRSLVR